MYGPTQASQGGVIPHKSSCHLPDLPMNPAAHAPAAQAPQILLHHHPPLAVSGHTRHTLLVCLESIWGMMLKMKTIAARVGVRVKWQQQHAPDSRMLHSLRCMRCCAAGLSRPHHKTPGHEGSCRGCCGHCCHHD